MSKNFIYLIILGLVCFCFGCEQNVGQGKVVAKINNYAMTTEDLKDEVANSPYASDMTTQELLDLAIKKQVLIQEAQKEGLDRKKSFLKTIERYWEQTLIKELLNKKIQGIYKTTSDKNEQTKELDDWVNQLYKKANIEIYNDVVKELEEKNKTEE